MKIFNYISKTVLAAVIITVFTYSCDNLQSPEVVDPIDTTHAAATINGAVKIQLASGTEESAPEGTAIRLVIDSDQFASNPEPGVDYQNLTYDAELGSAGEYSFKVPAKDEPIVAELYLDELTRDGVVYEANPNPLTISNIIVGFTVHADTVTYQQK